MFLLNFKVLQYSFFLIIFSYIIINYGFFILLCDDGVDLNNAIYSNYVFFENYNFLSEICYFVQQDNIYKPLFEYNDPNALGLFYIVQNQQLLDKLVFMLYDYNNITLPTFYQTKFFYDLKHFKSWLLIIDDSWQNGVLEIKVEIEPLLAALDLKLTLYIFNDLFPFMLACDFQQFLFFYPWVGCLWDIFLKFNFLVIDGNLLTLTPIITNFVYLLKIIWYNLIDNPVHYILVSLKSLVYNSPVYYEMLCYNNYLNFINGGYFEIFDIKELSFDYLWIKSLFINSSLLEFNQFKVYLMIAATNLLLFDETFLITFDIINNNVSQLINFLIFFGISLLFFFFICRYLLLFQYYIFINLLGFIVIFIVLLQYIDGFDCSFFLFLIARNFFELELILLILSFSFFTVFYYTKSFYLKNLYYTQVKFNILTVVEFFGYFLLICSISILFAKWFSTQYDFWCFLFLIFLGWYSIIYLLDLFMENKNNLIINYFYFKYKQIIYLYYLYKKSRLYSFSYKYLNIYKKNLYRNLLEYFMIFKSVFN